MPDIALWDVNNRPILLLITPELLEVLPNGTILYSVTGRQVIVGTDYIDDDTRSGFLAYGFHLEHERDALGRYL
jgi:hypothetical protein